MADKSLRDFCKSERRGSVMQQVGNGGPAVGPHAIFGLDTDGRCTHSTGPALTYLGLRPGQLVGTDLFELYRDDAINVAALRRVLTGESFSLEREFQGRILSTYFEPVRDVDGTVTGALGVTTDITEQRRIEGQLRAARERASLLADVSAALSREVLDPEALLRTAVRSVTDVVAEVGLVWVRELGEREMAPRAAWRSGVDQGKLTDTPLPTSDGPARLDISVVEALSGPRSFDLDVADDADFGFLSEPKRSGAATGLRVPLRSRGVLLGVIDIARDAVRGEFTEEEIDLVREIAERCALALDNALLLNAHREAREELVKFQALADASDNLIAISDHEDRTVYLNPRVRASGLQLTRRVWEIATSAHVEESLQDAMRNGLETAGRWSGDLTMFTPDSPLTASVSVFRLFHPDTGAPLGTGWIGQDVTELRATEAALREANSDLMQFKALMDASPDFIAIASMEGGIQYVNPGGREMIGM
ncbi:MAG: PAS domain-containing protein, partial [Nocardioidaceae bacterium]